MHDPRPDEAGRAGDETLHVAFALSLKFCQ
jgi:hypothetical protein